MKKSVINSPVRKVDNSLSIISLFDGASFNFDFVIAELRGNHPKLINLLSDRAYFFLEGNGTVYVGENVYKVSKDDLILIKANTAHGLEGNLRYIIITSPPFNPENEKLV